MKTDCASWGALVVISPTRNRRSRVAKPRLAAARLQYRSCPKEAGWGILSQLGWWQPPSRHMRPPARPQAACDRITSGPRRPLPSLLKTPRKVTPAIRRNPSQDRPRPAPHGCRNTDEARSALPALRDTGTAGALGSWTCPRGTWCDANKRS